MRTYALILLLCQLALPQAQRDLLVTPTHTRHALVIGNAAYPKWPLKNPLNDAAAVATSLNEIGFQTTTATNLTLRSLEQSVNTLTAKVKSGDVVLFYYAGHGIQIDGDNYLVPVDFDAKDEVDAKYSAYSATRIQERLERAGARVIVVVLDACRNNPFQATRSLGNGLAAMGSGKGSLIAFATAPGKTADDNPRGSNGLFTSHLVEALRQPGLSLDQIFNRVRERVYQDSQGKQVPWTVSSVIGEVYLRPGQASPSQASPSQASPSQAVAAANPLAQPKPTAPNPLARPRETPPAPPTTPPLDQAAAYFKQQQWDLFLSSAREAIASGSSIPFALGHHHTLTAAHASVLTVTRDTIAYQSIGTSCNQPNFTYPLSQLVAAQVITSNKGEILLNLKVLDEKGKQRTLNFADPDSTIQQDSNGLPQIISPPKAFSQLGAIVQLLTSLR